jgi:hypothetical protein
MGNAIKCVKAWLEKMKLQPPPSEQQVGCWVVVLVRVCVCGGLREVRARCRFLLRLCAGSRRQGAAFCGRVLRHSLCSAALDCLPLASLVYRFGMLMYRRTAVPQAKDELVERISDYLEQKIRFADRMLVKHGIEKIQVGACSSRALRSTARSPPTPQLACSAPGAYLLPFSPPLSCLRSTGRRLHPHLRLLLGGGRHAAGGAQGAAGARGGAGAAAASGPVLPLHACGILRGLPARVATPFLLLHHRLASRPPPPAGAALLALFIARKEAFIATSAIKNIISCLPPLRSPRTLPRRRRASALTWWWWTRGRCSRGGAC